MGVPRDYKGKRFPRPVCFQREGGTAKGTSFTCPPHPHRSADEIGRALVPWPCSQGQLEVEC